MWSHPMHTHVPLSIFIPHRVRRKFLAPSSPRIFFQKSLSFPKVASFYEWWVITHLCSLNQRFGMLTMSRIFGDCLSSTGSGNLRASSSKLPWGWHSPRQQQPSPCLITGELLPPRYYVFLPWSSHRPWTEVEGLARDERVRQGQWQWQANSELWWAWSELWQRLFLQCFAKAQCGYQGGWQPRGSLTLMDVQDRRLRR